MSDARETFASLCKQLWGAGITDNTKSFHLVSRPADGDKLFLDVGKVQEVASVKLNGEDLAVQWTKPMRVEITGAVKIGENELQITVVSLWPNRLRADELLPRSERLTETNITSLVPQPQFCRQDCLARQE